MKAVWTILAVITGFWVGGAEDARAYYGRNSTEATLKFEARIDAPFSARWTVPSLNHAGRARSEALALVDEQVAYLMGTFQSASFVESFGYPGVLGEKHEIVFTSAEPSREAGRMVLSYRFEGKVVFQKQAFRSGQARNVPIRLPISPDRIYALGVVRGTNRCTDRHYNSREDFWYFWDPEMAGCPLALDDRDAIFNGTGRLEPLPNTRSTYPEYDRLFGDNGNGDDLDVAVFIGYIEDVNDLRWPNRRDDGTKALRYLEKDLRDRGFALAEKVDSFREYADGRRVPGINFLRRYERDVSAFGRTLHLRVTALLADTDSSSRDATFHRHVARAFETADVLAYDGHSGLGGNLDLGTLPDIRFDRSKYQVFYFNGCSSYPYFNGMYFDAKGGTRNTDIVTSGLPTFTYTAGPNVVSFIDHFIDAEPRSWQKILSDIESSNDADAGTYLTGVNGDEDNRWRP